MLTAPIFDGLTGIRHGFFTRSGGKSRGVFASLNCGYGSGDDQASVRWNRGICAASLGVDESRLLTAYQRHTADAVAAAEAWAQDKAPVADAIVTTTPGLAVGVLTADCAPVLFADPVNRVIAAAHAGWKGALTGILETTITEMETAGAARQTIRAAVGPCIAQRSYEVGPEFQARFISEQSADATHFAPSAKDGHWMFDLPGFVMSRLKQSDIREIAWIEADTYVDRDRFFSYRRTCHRGETDYGRQISAIALAG